MYEPDNGLVTTVMNVMGLGAFAQNWLGDPSVVNFSLMGAVAWWTTGFAFLVFFAGLRNIPTECIEAARIEGASPWQVFWKVSFPLLWPSTIIVLGMAAIDAMPVRRCLVHDQRWPGLLVRGSGDTNVRPGLRTLRGGTH